MTFRSANGANVTVTFALATVPMIGFVGASIDYSHANSVKTAMQAAADSTALMLSRIAASSTSAELQTKGNDYFKALFNRPEANGLNIDINYTNTSGSVVKVAATANVKTDFMKMMGFSNLKIGVDSTAKWGNTRMRVALALDTTGSMDNDGKMEALKTATKSLLDPAQDRRDKNGDVYVSIIPFSKGVNVSGIEQLRTRTGSGGPASPTPGTRTTASATTTTAGASRRPRALARTRTATGRSTTTTTGTVA